ncbi:MAG: hypothetical protein QOJ42_5407 [Acidobacteriaceae bacterium]|nr:hypothetical protein [Acidobacteriaceae bacterium]
MNLVAYPLSRALYSVVSVKIIGRVYADRRRWKVAGMTPTQYTVLLPILRDPALGRVSTAGRLRKYGGASSVQIFSSRAIPSRPTSSAVAIIPSLVCVCRLDSKRLAYFKYQDASTFATTHVGSTVDSTFRVARIVSPTSSLRFMLRIEATTCVESVRISLRSRSIPSDLHLSRNRSNSDISAWPSISRSRKRDRIE